jgi:uncharacterized protein YecT (DUF1311 family)
VRRQLLFGSLAGPGIALLALALAAPTTLKGQGATALNCDSAKTTADMRTCAVRELKDAKRDLDRYLREARRLASNRALLDSAQAVWQRFADLACRSAGSQYEGGTIQPVVVLSCLVDATRKRLHQIYDNFLRTSKTKLPEPQ